MRLALFWLAVSSRARYDPGKPQEHDGRVPSRRPSDREVADSGVRREEAERMPWFPSHSTVCDGRPCAPGEGNLQHVREDTPRGWRYKQWTQPYIHREAWVQARSRDVPHSPDEVAVYGDAVALAKRTALDGRVVVTSGDWDYRELVLNFVLHAHKLAYHNTLVLSMEAELHSDLTARAIPSADLSRSLAAWNETCLQRHIQAARTERHVAVAAMLAAGIDVLLCDATVVLLRPVVAELAAIPADLLVQRDAWPEDPVRKVGVAANAGFYYAHGTAAVSEFVLSAVRRGLIEFYLRWNNIGDQYGLSFVMADAKMDAKADGGAGGAGGGRRGGRGRSSPTANETTLATFHPSGSHCKQRGNCLRLGWLPYDRFPRTGSWDGLQPSAAIYHLTHGCMQEAAPCSVPGSRPFRGHRQRQDRYEKVDFDDMRSTLRALGMWLVDATPSYRYRRPPLPLRPEL